MLGGGGGGGGGGGVEWSGVGWGGGGGRGGGGMEGQFVRRSVPPTTCAVTRIITGHCLRATSTKPAGNGALNASI